MNSRPRISWSVVLYALLVLAIVALGLVTIEVPGEASKGGAASPAPSASASASAAASVAPGPTTVPVGTAMGDRLGDINDAALGFVAGVGMLLVVLPLLGILIVKAVRRIWTLLGHTQLVVEDIGDATGDEAVKAQLAGLSQDLRLRIHEAADNYLQILKQLRKGEALGADVKAPAPRQAADDGLKNIVDALKESSPDQGKLVLGLLGAVFPPRGRRIKGVLAVAGPPPKGLRMTAEITDLADPRRSVLGALDESIRADPVGAGNPPSKTDDEKKAAAKVITGAMYESKGHWDEAMALYQGALEALPNSAEAREGIERLLSRPDVSERARRFLSPVGQWLALMLFRSEWQRDLRAGKEGSPEQERARIHNFVGWGLMNLATEVPALNPVGLYQQAIDEFAAASAALPAWYLPYANRADATSYLAEASPASARQADAIAMYATAATKALETTGYVSKQMATDPLRRAAGLKIAISKAIATFLNGQRVQAIADVEAALGPDWTPSTENDPRVLYALACFRARQASVTLDRTPLAQAMTALAFAFVGRTRYLITAASDPDLKGVRATVLALLAADDWEKVAKLPRDERARRIQDALAKVV